MNAADVLADLSDEALVRRAQAGYADAFDVLVQRHAPAVVRFIGRTFTESHERQDIAQEVLVAAWKSLPRFDGRSTFRTWLYALASRKTVDELRRRRPVPVDTAGAPETPYDGPGPDRAAESTDFLTALQAELSRLPYPARAAWWLREVDGLTIAEIATVLRTTQGSVRGHLTRTRSRLTETLERYRP